MLRNYLKIAIRNLQKNKVYCSLNVMGLALSIGCCILIFSLVRYHLSFDIFHKDSNRIYRFVTEQHRDDISYTPTVPPGFGFAFKKDYDFAEAVARVVKDQETLVMINQANKVAKFNEPGVAFVETDYFKIFQVEHISGILPQQLTSPGTAIVTESIAKKYFGSTNVLNKIIRIQNKVDCAIAGVIADPPKTTDVAASIFVSWSTLKPIDRFLSGDDVWGGMRSALSCYTKLKPGVRIADVEKLLPAYVKQFRPKSKNVHHYKLQPIAEMHFDGRYGGSMDKGNIWMLAFTGLFLLLTACVNFINLSTAQALRRSREVGVRKVLGSLRAQLFWQFIAETAFITLLATALGIAMSRLALPYVNELFKSSVSLNLFADWQLMLFLPVLMVLVTFLAGAYPGILLSGFRPVIAIRSKLSMQQVGGFNIRRSLIVTQFAISFLLIIGMFVMNRQMRYALKSDLGFVKESIVIIPMGADSLDMLAKTIRDRFASIPGVEKVSMCFAAPADGSAWNTSIRFENRAEDEPFRVSMKSADDQYLPAFGLQLASGRNLFPTDSVREFVVNETMVRKLQLGSPKEAIGKMISFEQGEQKGAIVGVVKDFHDLSFHEDINAIAITTYSDDYIQYAVRINQANMLSVLPKIEEIWATSYPDKIYEHQFLDKQVEQFYNNEATMLTLVTSFSIIAIFIGCLGLYGLVTFMVAQKTKEIGIRKVLGSGVGKIVWIFGKEFMLLIGIAFLISAPIGWWMMKTWLQDFQYQVPIGAGVFAMSALIVVGIAALTVAYHSVTAALANPVKSLRDA